MLRFQVLGEVRAWRDGEPIALGPAARRAVLGLLALAGGQPLSRDELAAGVWHGRTPPPSAVNVLHTHVKHLRRLLEPERQAGREGTVLRRVGDGYALHVPAGAIDVLEFRSDVAAAAALRREGRLAEAAAMLEGALARWHGPAFADLPGVAGYPKLVALAEERQAALDRYADVMIAVGRAADVLAVLEEEAAARPLDEAAQARLIMAYRGSGRRDRAFATYHAMRRRLADDLGVDPGPELEAVYADLLHDRRPAPVDGPGDDEEAAAPAQVIADLPVFAGRTAELSALDDLLEPKGPAVAVLSGPAGMGKTSLAVHWAHQVADRFPDGQLYVNLRGFQPTGSAMEPGEALRLFLGALGVAVAEIPADLEARAALYRSRLSGRRMLVVLDNAADASQVRPLLPAGPHCRAVITSRNQLAGLVATHAARPLALRPLATSEAHDLLVRRIGADRMATEPQAAAEIVERCAGLPLALAIFAARAVIDGGHPLRAYADELAGGLDALAIGDQATSVREVFSWSYQALSEPAARLFRLLGIHPGPDVSAAAVASLAGWPPGEVRAGLAELVSVSLVLAPVPGRYALHDLVRMYAAELAGAADPVPSRNSAVRRMLAHYVHTAYAADRLLNPPRDEIVLSTPPKGVAPEPLADSQEALDWFLAEHAVLLALVDHAVATGRDTETWQLVWTLWTFLDRQAHWLDLAATSQAAVAAAARVAGPSVQADAYRMLARACTRLFRLAEAYAQLQIALELYERAGDRNGQAHAHLNTALVSERRGEYADALDHASTAVDLFAALGDRAALIRARNAVGWYHALLGDHVGALLYCQAALADKDCVEEAPLWDTLGYAHYKLGNQKDAVACFERALDLYREIGDRHLEGLVLIHLADGRYAAGETAEAYATWREALDILADLDPPAAEQIRTSLAAASY